MRLITMAALTAIGLGIAATSGAYAAPINAASIGKTDTAKSQPTKVHYYGWGWGWGWGGFAAGAAAGAILGGMLAAPYYYAPGPYYYAPGPAYYGGYYDDDVRYCMQRFRSYDPRSGTYLGRDGYRHPCP